jgi:hypothetical protein
MRNAPSPFYQAWKLAAPLCNKVFTSLYNFPNFYLMSSNSIKHVKCKKYDSKIIWKMFWRFCSGGWGLHKVRECREGGGNKKVLVGCICWAVRCTLHRSYLLDGVHAYVVTRLR